MSASSNPRSVVSTSDRRSIAPSESASVRPSRVPSGRVPEREPRSSASARPPSSATQSRHQPGRSKGDVPVERRSERTRITTRETVSVRTTKSPVKEREAERTNAGSRAGAGSSAGLRRESEKEKEVVQGPWIPQASIVPYTTAPLASRMSVPPLASQAPASLQPAPLSQLPLEYQENAILEDLLYVFMGCEGQYIRFVDSYDPSSEKDRLTGPAFRILPGLDPSLRDLTTTMLKMATHYAAVDAFVDVQSREEFGAVNHALCAAIRRLLKDYMVLIAQLETQFLTNPGLTLHVLHLHTLPTGHMLSQLYSLAYELLRKNSMLEEDLEDSVEEMDDVDNIIEALNQGGDLGLLPGKKICKGGSVLGLLSRRLASMSGDPAARTLLTTLLREASRPYMSMLNEWLHHGGIRDPHAEFLVKEQKSIRRERLEEDYTDEYWEKRYTIRTHDVPPQLEGVKDKVLLAGKYLNVVRECGGVDVSNEVRDVPKTFDDARFLDNVNAAYAHANSSLLNLLLTTHALPARLRSLKHYFFLDRSDWFSYFLELGTSELKKQARHVNVNKLQSLLDLVLRQPGSVAGEDPFKEDVKVQMNEVSLTKWLMRVVNVSGIDQESWPAGGVDTYQTPATVPAAAQPMAMEGDKNIAGFDALELDYSVPFPLSLVISRKTVLRYQLLFRHLLSLRHLETLLVGSWLEHGKVASWRHKGDRSTDPQLEMWKRRAWTLRARMLVFVQQLLYFSTAEVMEPNWQRLMANLEGDDGKPADGSTKQVTRTVDELMQDHVDFLDTCLKECMLTNSKLLRLHSKIMTTCTMFAAHTSYFSKSLVSADAALAASTSTPHEPGRIAKLNDVLTKYEENFGRHLRILLDALNYYAATETVVLLGLCARLSTASEGTVGGGAGGVGGFVGE
ncbi:MAG: hypothetical protein M1832_002185 [Thelocarpon impressellum]|nr:MAG: hypothetical protein M1832_002185 [Thelocarpon impressellum]